MLTEEQQEQQERRPWQLHHKKSTSSEMKRVAWPPVGSNAAEIPKTNENDNGIASVPQQNDADDEIAQRYQDHSNRFSNQHQVSNGSKVAPPVPPKPGAREIANAQKITRKANLRREKSLLCGVYSMMTSFSGSKCIPVVLRREYNMAALYVVAMKLIPDFRKTRGKVMTLCHEILVQMITDDKTAERRR